MKIALLCIALAAAAAPAFASTSPRQQLQTTPVSIVSSGMVQKIKEYYPDVPQEELDALTESDIYEIKAILASKMADEEKKAKLIEVHSLAFVTRMQCMMRGNCGAQATQRV